MKMNVLSLCDGMSCGQIALKELNINIENYFASEIYDKAIKVTQENFPNTIQIGDLINLRDNKEFLNSLPKIDLIYFGSPCRNVSKVVNGRNEYNGGLKGQESWLFYPCAEILNYIKSYNNKDVLFLCENVDGMSKQDREEVSKTLGVNYIQIDSNLFSAGDRVRLYWTNIPYDVFELPKENGIVLKDILEKNVPEEYYYNCGFTFHGYDKKVCATLFLKGHDIMKRVNNENFKSATLTSCRGGNLQKKVFDTKKNLPRKLTPNEYRKIQTIPDWYKMNVAKSHIYNMCGDGWTIEVIKWFFKFIP